MAGVVNSHPSNLAIPVGADADALAVAPKPVDIPMAQPQADQAAPQGEPPVPLQGTANPPPVDPLEALANEHVNQVDPLEALADSHAGPQESDADIKKSAAQADKGDFSGHEAKERMRSSFAKSDEQKQLTLEQAFGPSNVKKIDSTHYFKTDDGQWHKESQGVWAALKNMASLGSTNQTARDLSGSLPDVASIGAMAGGEALTGGLGTIAARGLGGVAGEATKDIGASVMGLPDDPNGSASGDAKRYAAAAGTNIGAGFVGDVAAYGLKKTANLVANAKASRALAKAGGDWVSGLTSEQRALGNVAHSIELNDAALKSGISLDAHHLNPNDTEAMALAERARAIPELQAASKERGAVAAKGMDDIYASTGGDATKAATNIKEGSVLDQVHGKAIDAFRKGALKTASTAESDLVPADNVSKALDQVRSLLGFEGTKPPALTNIDDMAARLNMKPAVLRTLVKDGTTLGDKVVNSGGKLSLSDVNNSYEMFKKFTNAHYDPSAGQQSQAFKAFVSLKDGFRDDLSQGIGQFLGPEQQAAYQTSMSRYAQMKQAFSADRGLAKLFEKGSPANHDIVQYLKNTDADGVARIKAVLGQDVSDGWANIQDAYLQDIRNTARYRISDKGAAERLGGWNWKNLESDLLDGSKKSAKMEQILGSETTEKMRNLSKAMSAVQDKDMKFLAANPGLLAKATAAMGAIATKNPKLALSLMMDSDASVISAMAEPGKNKAVLKYIQGNANLQQVINKTAMERHSATVAKATVRQHLTPLITSGLNKVIDNNKQE